MYKPSTWRTIPLPVLLVELIRLRSGTIRDRELYEMVKQIQDISYHEFLKALLILEVRGIISVSLQKENVRIITLLKK